LQSAADEAGVPLVVNRVGSMLTPFFLKKGKSVTNFAEATACDTDAYAKFFHAMLNEGIFLAPSQFEAMFVGLAHHEEQIAQTITAAKKAFSAIHPARGKKN
jgi:glutamate-1-semialdehyde 2,1-aminomutase